MKSEPCYILGVSAFYHDSAAALLCDGIIVAAVQEERFTRKKADDSFPEHSIRWLLSEAGIGLEDLNAIVFYDKPFLKFERLLETYHHFLPKGLRSFLISIPIWIKDKLFFRRLLKNAFDKIGSDYTKILFAEHHLSHAASAFYPSPFEDAAILTIDGVGEWGTTVIGKGCGRDITFIKEIRFPHSLGLLYSAFTYYCGFRVNSGEYKLMGLAPYGNPDSDRTREYIDKIKTHVIDIKSDGSFLLNMAYFNYAVGLTMSQDSKWETLFGLKRRLPESDLSEAYMDLALAIQTVTEDIVLKLAQTASALTGSENLVMAGGVALNCVANGKLKQQPIFKNIWIQPASGDAGGALGAALCAWHIYLKEDRVVQTPDSMSGSYLGPSYCRRDNLNTFRKYGAVFKHYASDDLLIADVIPQLEAGKVIGWFQGSMEFGPRALGNRSIIGDPRQPDMQKKLNLKIKFREGFRPFAPIVKEEAVSVFFDYTGDSPYMLMVAPVKESIRRPLPDRYHELPLAQRLYHLRSDLPAITHVDYSARLQTVSKTTNFKLWALLDAFEMVSGYPILINTSFNVRGEPIVCTPEDAYRCFMRTDMDILVIENFLLIREDQPPFEDIQNWRDTYVLD